MRKIALLILLSGITSYLFAQGCSDAGACSIYHYERGDESQKQLKASLSQTLELGEKNAIINQTVSSFTFLFDQTQIGISLPYRQSFYNGEYYKGLADVTVSGGYSFNDKINFGLAFKLPVHSANELDKEGFVRPMALQTSLGTYDAILSMNYEMNDWGVGVAYQHALTSNENTFIQNKKYEEFLTTADFERGDDVVLRFDRYLKGDAKTWHFALVSVYRLNGDYSLGQKIKGSEGASFNVLIDHQWHAKENRTTNVFFAMPLRVREARPDGLTRTFILGAKMSGLFTQKKSPVYSF